MYGMSIDTATCWYISCDIYIYYISSDIYAISCDKNDDILMYIYMICQLILWYISWCWY